MAHIDLQKYFVEEKGHETGRPRYDREKLLKVVLFAFMEFGYCSVRFIKKLCETDIRFMWLVDEEVPSHMTICHFIRQELSMCLSDMRKFLAALQAKAAAQQAPPLPPAPTKRLC